MLPKGSVRSQVITRASASSFAYTCPDMRGFEEHTDRWNRVDQLAGRFCEWIEPSDRYAASAVRFIPLIGITATKANPPGPSYLQRSPVLLREWQPKVVQTNFLV